MRILRIIDTDPSKGGPTEGAIRQAALMAEMRHETQFASLEDANATFIKNCPVKVFAFGKKTPPKGWCRFLPWLHRQAAPDYVPWLKAHVGDYDLVIVHGLWNYSVQGAQMALRNARVPYVVFTHGMLDPWFRKTYPLKQIIKQISWWFYEGPLLNNAKAVLFTTEEEKILARKAFYPYRVREKVVGYGTSDVCGDAPAQKAAFRKRIPALGSRPYLLYLSRIHAKKGCDLLIDAFAQIAEALPDVDLVIAGPDKANLGKKLKAQAERLGVSERIHWPGMLSGDEKWGAFRGAEAFVLPSHQENFGIAVAEAMAAGIPVLITDKVNIWRKIETSGSGLVEHDDKEGIRRLLRRFCAMRADERQTMARKARQTFLEQFELSQLTRSTVVLFSDIISGKAV